MKLNLDPRVRRAIAAVPNDFGYRAVEAGLLVLLAWCVVRILFVAITPLGPVGAWRPIAALAGDPTLLTRFDPFFRLADQRGQVTVTSLALKLFGVRINEAAGRGSAIIATPDGLQSSFAVGDEIVPGVKLRSVAFDSVTIDRSGSAEQIFLDQSKPAIILQSAAATSAPAPLPPATAPTPGSIASDIALTPRIDGGRVTGFTVNPKGAGSAFNAAGFQPGDVVTLINGTRFSSAAEAAASLANPPQSGIVSFTVERAGKIVTLNTQVPQ